MCSCTAIKQKFGLYGLMKNKCFKKLLELPTWSRICTCYFSAISEIGLWNAEKMNWRGGQKIGTKRNNFLLSKKCHTSTLICTKCCAKKNECNDFFKGMVFCYQNCSRHREKLLKFEAEGREFAKILRSLEQFIQTVKGQNKFW